MQIHVVDSLTVNSWLESGKAVLIDVREPSEFQSLHISGAVNIPKGRVMLNTLPNHAGKKLVFQCRSGVRSKRVCKKILQENGAVEVYSLKGGIKAWQSQGFETEQKDSSYAAEEKIIMLVTAFLVCAAVLLLVT